MLLTGEEIAVSATAAAAPARGRRRAALRRLEPAALAGVMSRDVTNFKSFWKTTTFSSILDPTIYLLAFGLGFGTLVAAVDGIDYVEFVGTGMVATAVLFSSAFSGDVRRRSSSTASSAPTTRSSPRRSTSRSSSRPRSLWTRLRAGVYGIAPLLVDDAVRPRPVAGACSLVPFIGASPASASPRFGVFAAASASKIDHFNYIQSALLTPLFLVAGHVLPDRRLPQGAQTLAQLNPLYHCVAARARRGVRVRGRPTSATSPSWWSSRW